MHARDRLSTYYLLTRTFLFISKRVYQRTIEDLAANLTGFVVDIGCGAAPYRPLFRAARAYVGLDRNSKCRPDIVADAHALPLASESVNGVVCSEVIEHVVDPDGVLREVSRVLVADGMLLLTAPMSWNLHYEPYDFRRYTCYGLWQLLQAHGFVVLETKRIGGLFSLIGSRLVEGIASELYRRLWFLPRRIRHGLLLCYTVPTSLFFFALACLGDNFERTDAIGWAVLARKSDHRGLGEGRTCW